MLTKRTAAKRWSPWLLLLGLPLMLMRVGCDLEVGRLCALLLLLLLQLLHHSLRCGCQQPLQVLDCRRLAVPGGGAGSCCGGLPQGDILQEVLQTQGQRSGGRNGVACGRHGL